MCRCKKLLSTVIDRFTRQINERQKLVLSIAIIAKGQPQKQNVQLQFNQLTLQPNRVIPLGQTKVEIVQEQIDAMKPAPPLVPFEPLKFPSNEEELPIALQQQQLQLQQLDPLQQPQPQPQQSVLEPYKNEGQINAPKPMRVAVATAPLATNKDKIDQFDYIRDFSWTLFQVNA